MKPSETMQVLIAEDDALVSDGIAKQLVRLGYQPAGQAYDGVQAVELTCQHRPSVVLMDLQMIDPQTGREDAEAGLKASRAIQERCPAAVIVLTAHESPDLVRRARDAGVNGYLVKPAADLELDRTIAIARARFEDVQKSRARVVELERSNKQMQEALSKNQVMSGLLSLCAWCSQVQDEHGLWQELEVYVRKHSNLTFSHGVCPQCFKRLSPRFNERTAET